MTYQETAKKIIKNHIRSAIYIDENAREPFSPCSNPALFEENLSVDLYEEFAQNNIQLTTYKYTDLNYNQRKDLIKGRDFVLLDWKLSGETGEDRALNVISDIVEARPQIIFCGIYTKEQPSIVFQNILSYFSGITNHECEEIKLDLLLEDEENYRDFIAELGELVLDGRFEDRQIDSLKRSYANIIEKDFFTKGNDEIKDKLIRCWCAYSNFHKNPVKNLSILSYKYSDNVLLVNNTFIVILNKTTTTFDRLLNKFTGIVADYSNGFSLLMSMELNGIIQNKSMIMDPAITSIPKELFAYHKMKDKDGFEAFMKDIVLNGVSLNILDEQLTTLQGLTAPERTFRPNIDDILRMNVFYNSIYRSGNNVLTFGDVFKHEDDDSTKVFYYICITPLCDCVNPKNENTFYFAKGYPVERSSFEKEIKRSEEVFVSYLPNNIVIRWTDSSEKGKPIYITPIPFTIPTTIIKNNHIRAYKLKAQISKKEKMDLVYVGTLKQNYAQRIANHAFTHSIRVGITFFPHK